MDGRRADVARRMLVAPPRGTAAEDLPAGGLGSLCLAALELTDPRDLARALHMHPDSVDAAAGTGFCAATEATAPLSLDDIDRLLPPDGRAHHRLTLPLPPATRDADPTDEFDETFDAPVQPIPPRVVACAVAASSRDVALLVRRKRCTADAERSQKLLVAGATLAVASCEPGTVELRLTAAVRRSGAWQTVKRTHAVLRTSPGTPVRLQFAIGAADASVRAQASDARATATVALDDAANAGWSRGIAVVSAAPHEAVSRYDAGWLHRNHLRWHAASVPCRAALAQPAPYAAATDATVLLLERALAVLDARIENAPAEQHTDDRVAATVAALTAFAVTNRQRRDAAREREATDAEDADLRAALRTGALAALCSCDTDAADV